MGTGGEAGALVSPQRLPVGNPVSDRLRSLRQCSPCRGCRQRWSFISSGSKYRSPGRADAVSEPRPCCSCRRRDDPDANPRFVVVKPSIVHFAVAAARLDDPLYNANRQECVGGDDGGRWLRLGGADGHARDLGRVRLGKCGRCKSERGRAAIRRVSNDCASQTRPAGGLDCQPKASGGRTRRHGRSCDQTLWGRAGQNGLPTLDGCHGQSRAQTDAARRREKTRRTRNRANTRNHLGCKRNPVGHSHRSNRNRSPKGRHIGRQRAVQQQVASRGALWAERPWRMKAERRWDPNRGSRLLSG